MIRDEVILVYPGFNRSRFLHNKPRRTEIPMGILSVGSALKEAGFKPRLVDGRYENTRKKMRGYVNEKTLFVGISSMTCNQITFGIDAAKASRKINPYIPIVWGGMHPTVLPEETLKTCEYSDIVCRKEGEASGVELAKALQRGDSLEGIEGLSYKDKDGSIIHNPDRPFLDFDKLPIPDYGLLDKNVYDLSYLSYQGSRGCPHRCKFCEVGPIHNRRYRARRVETILADLEDILKRYPVRDINFLDENVFVDLDNARSFANGILERGMNFEWRAFCRADYFRKTDIGFWRLMKRAGCGIVNIGGESGSQKTLDNMRKDYKVEDIINAAAQLEEASLDNSFSFICGLPDETLEDIDETVGLVDRLLRDFKRVNIFEILVYMPLPETPFYEEVKAKGCAFPHRLEDWGTFLWGGKSFARWHPHHEHVFRLALISKWTKKIPAWKIWRSLRRLNPAASLMYLCGYVSYYRWRYKFFKWPLDIYMQYWLNRFVFKSLWQR